LSPKEQFADRCLLFLDVLGFSTLVNEGRHAELLPIIQERKKQVFRLSNMQGSARSADLQATLFSDCIVVSCLPNSEHSFELISNYASYLQNHFLWKGILCRGAIVIGPTHHKDNIIIGKAMIDAYHIESKEAFYPRILVTDDFKSRLENALLRYEDSPITTWRKSILFTDSDGRAIINPFMNADTPNIQSGIIRDVDIAPLVSKMRCLAKRQSKPAYAAKYDWMATTCEQIGKNPIYDSHRDVQTQP